MNMFLLCVIIILCATQISPDALSQGYRPGFIVQAEGDTIKGLIKYREGSSSYQSCIFKLAEESETSEYFPGDIQAYGITSNLLFESKNLVNSLGLSTKVFTKVLVNGNLKLYRHRGFFYLEKDEGAIKLLELTQTTTESEIGDKQVLSTSTQHMILLNSLTLDCPVPEALMVKLQKRLAETDIIEVVKAYNNCTEPNSAIIYKDSRPWVTVKRMGVSVGGHASTPSFAYGDPIKNAVFLTAHSIVYGALINITLPRRSDRLSLQLEPLYSQEKYEGYYSSSDSRYYTYDEYHMEMKRVGLSSMIRYDFKTKGKIIPYVGFGVSGSRIIDSKIKGLHDIGEYLHFKGVSNFEITESEEKIASNSYFSGTSAIGVGYRISQNQEISLQFRYEQGRYFLDYPTYPEDLRAYLSNTNNSFYLILAYTLK